MNARDDRCAAPITDPDALHGADDDGYDEEFEREFASVDLAVALRERFHDRFGSDDAM